MQIKTEARIYEKRNRSGSLSYRVDLGIVRGKRIQKTFRTREEAATFKRKADAEIRAKHSMGLADLSQSLRYEVLNALEKLKPYGASLDEAVTFFIKYAAPAKPAITLQEAIDQFVTIKSKAGLSPRYVDAALDYFRALKEHFSNCLVTEIDFKQAENYIYHKKHEWNPTTRRNHIRHGILLFNFLIERGYIKEGLNPFDGVPKPKQIESASAVLSVPDVSKVLQYALDNGAKEECAAMVLVLFCGVRVEEVEKMTWDLVDLRKHRVEVTAKIAKRAKRRSNEIPTNAISWLERCRSEGPILARNFDKRLQRVRKAAGIQYPQNAMRHSFASYHIAAFQDAAKTAMLLGHPDARLLYDRYRDVVHKEDAVTYWGILPADIENQREELIRSVEQAFSDVA